MDVHKWLADSILLTRIEQLADRVDELERQVAQGMDKPRRFPNRPPPTNAKEPARHSRNDAGPGGL